MRGWLFIPGRSAAFSSRIEVVREKGLLNTAAEYMEVDLAADFELGLSPTTEFVEKPAAIVDPKVKTCGG